MSKCQSTNSGTLTRQTVPVDSARVPSLRYWQTERILGQTELGVRAGVHPATVQRAEQGVPIRPAIIAKLSEALGVKPADQMGRPPES